MNERLTIAVSIEEDSLPAWVCEALKQLRDCELVFLQVSGLPPISPSRLATRVFLPQPAPDPFEASPALANFPDATLQAAQLTNGVLQTVLPVNAHVLLNTLPLLPAPDLCHALPLGCWQFFYFNKNIPATHCCGLPNLMACANEATWLLRQLSHKKPVLRAGLVQLADGQNRLLKTTESVLYHGTANVMLQKHYWKLSTLLVAAVAEWHALGTHAFLAKKKSVPSPQLRTREVSALLETRIRVRAYTMALFRVVERLFLDKYWYIRLKLNGKSLRLQPPAGRQWADCFYAEDGETRAVFFENFSWGEHGFISAATLSKHGKLLQEKPILKLSHHLSYPFVFKHGQQWYMVPESSAAGIVDLYKATAFPFEWKKAETLLIGKRLVDSTLLFYQNKWWLFAVQIDPRGLAARDNLYIYFSNSLEGGHWQPHPRNPVVSSALSARPAGNIFEENGQLFRPGQYAAVRYGFGIRLNRIATLNETEYLEEPVSSLKPRWWRGEIAMHTLSKAGNTTATDRMRRKLRWL